MSSDHAKGMLQAAEMAMEQAIVLEMIASFHSNPRLKGEAAAGATALTQLAESIEAAAQAR